MSALWGKMKVTAHATRREAVYQQCNQPGRQVMSRSIAINWCLLCVWATKICHFDSLHQYATCAMGCHGRSARWRV